MYIDSQIQLVTSLAQLAHHAQGTVLASLLEGRSGDAVVPLSVGVARTVKGASRNLSAKQTPTVLPVYANDPTRPFLHFR